MLDWTSDHDEALTNSIGDAVELIHLVQAECLQTPRIQLWHTNDEQQTIQWKALDDSFGPRGAETLWRNRPSCDDILGLVEDNELEQPIAIHIILEVGADAPGGGDDALVLTEEVWERISFLGVEPVAFPQEGSDRVSIRDAQSCVERLTRLVPHLDYVSPDRNLFPSISSSSDDADECLWDQVDVVTVRNGPEGSVVMENGHEVSIPAATLHTRNGAPVNPTGAGNAYSAAFAACRAFGACSTEAACLASAIGAVVCEYEQLPPWSYQVLDRIREATMEIQQKQQEQRTLATTTTTTTTIGKQPPLPPHEV
jgi:hypothetical protein